MEQLEKITLTLAWLEGWVKDNDFFDDFNGTFTMSKDIIWWTKLKILTIKFQGVLQILPSSNSGVME